MEYTLKSGKKLTDEDIKLISDAVENGDLDILGSVGKIVVGRPRLSNEPLLTMTFKIPKSQANRISTACKQEGITRSDFLRKASIKRADEVLA